MTVLAARRTMLLLARTRSVLRVALVAVAMAAIFVADTLTNYEVAAAVLYAVVVLSAERALQPRALRALGMACIAMTVLSFMLTPRGHYHAGLINMGLSVSAIAMVTWLVLRMQRARAAAQAAQARLERIARAQNLSGLTTSIAHELNQPLAAIVTSGNAAQRWLAQAPPQLDKARQALQRMQADAERASSVIARVRSLTRGEPPQASRFDLNASVREIVALSHDRLQEEGIDLHQALAAGLPPVWADPVQVQQVIGNLLLNALDAMPAAPGARREVHIDTAREGDTVVFTIRDSGIGLAPEVQAHLFDAFWTTKPQGIGIGLSISRTIVEANGGRIWAEPAAGLGAVFRFSLPAPPQEKLP